MAGPIDIWCGPDRPPRSKLGENVILLNAIPGSNNVHLKISNISRKLVQNPPPLLLDLLEIAGYVYSGDQAATRGGNTLPADGANWKRELRFHIPVRNLTVWKSETVSNALTEALEFLSGDYYSFIFRPIKKEHKFEEYFEFEEGQPWFRPDEVMLFSGGLDSLAGLCEAVKTRKGKIVLLSHRSAPQTDKLQRTLLKDFQDLTGSESRLLHIPVWVNKQEKITKDTHQRTRSFLYASLAAVVARMSQLSDISFYENGITSSNLKIAPSLLGSRASRTTHPKALKGLSKFYSALFGINFGVHNPFFWHTKADVVRAIKVHGGQSLIRFTASCSHIRSGDTINTHCGVCSQCIGRRLAIIQNCLEDEDPEEMYKIKMPLDPVTKGDGRAMVELIIKAGRDYQQNSETAFYEEHSGLISTIVTSLDGKTAENATRLYELHKHHGHQVCEVLEKFVSLHKGLIAGGDVPVDSLLSMITGTFVTKKRESAGKRLNLPEGTKWEDITIEIVGLDAAKVYSNGKYEIYTAFEMGFENMKTKLPNRLWDLLTEFAEGKGRLNWDTKERSRTWNQKDFQRLRNGLRAFTGLRDDPFLPWTTADGFVCRFKILYDRNFPDSLKD